MVPEVPGCAPAPTAPGWASFLVVGGSCWSGGCGQGAEPLPAGGERLLPRPVRADAQGPLTGEAGGDVPDPVAERVRVGVAEFLVVAVAEEAGQAARSAAMTQPALTCQVFEGRLRRPMALAARTPPVSTTVCSRWTVSMCVDPYRFRRHHIKTVLLEPVPLGASSSRSIRGRLALLRWLQGPVLARVRQ
jgi:hypothetical protein